MKVPFVNWPKEYSGIKKEIDTAIKGVLTRGDFILRDELEKFEKKLAKRVGTKYAVGLNSGTDALYLALRALGIKEGDMVITVSHTFIATIEAIERCGAYPILIDIDDDYLMDIYQLEEMVEKGTTKAIIPVHLSGDVCDMRRIKAVANYCGAKIVEDAAQALGAKGIGVGDVQTWSFYPAKILGCYGDAGAITTNNKKVADQIRKWRHHSYIGKNLGVENDTVTFGVNSRLDNLQAAVLNVKMDHLDESLERRKEIAEMYTRGMSTLPIVLPKHNKGRVWQDYIIRAKDRDELKAHLDKKGVETLGAGLIPNHMYKGLELDFKLRKTEKYTYEFLRLPCNPSLTDEQVKYVIKAIRKFYE